MFSVWLSERESERSEGVDFLRVRMHLGIGEHARAGDKREAREGEEGGGGGGGDENEHRSRVPEK